jgi:alpha-1,3-rhamnosyl/mannosyltransferase
VVAIDGRVIADRFPGIGRYVYELVRALPDAAPDLSLVLLVDRGAAPGRLDARELAGPRCALVPVDAGVRSVAAQWRIPRALAAHRAAVFHATYWVTAYRPGVPTVLSIHDLIGLQAGSGLGRVKRWGLRLALRLALRSATEVVTLSDWSRAAILGGARKGGESEQDAGEGGHAAGGWSSGPAPSPEHVTTTPLAAGAAFRPATQEQIAAARTALALPDRYVLYLGSAKPHKNLRTVVDAWRSAGPRLPRVHLVLAGAWGPEGDAIRAVAATLPDSAPTLILGGVPDHLTAGLLSGAAVFAFPSLLEGFGLPPLEAMACGVPVVAARAASLPEVLGDAGILVEPLDTQAWADALVRVVGDAALTRELRQNGLARASHFSWEETARKTAAVYRRAALAADA